MYVLRLHIYVLAFSSCLRAFVVKKFSEDLPAGVDRHRDEGLIEIRELMIQTMSLQSPASELGLTPPTSTRPVVPAKARSLVQSLVNQLKSSTSVKSTKRRKKSRFAK